AREVGVLGVGDVEAAAGRHRSHEDDETGQRDSHADYDADDHGLQAQASHRTSLCGGRPRMAAKKRWRGSILLAMAVLLVTNDDGGHAAGLAALAEALEPLGDIWVIAPEREQSACGHALTMHLPLRPHRLGERRYALNGTPSDCVNLGVLGFLPERPALIVSG